MNKVYPSSAQALDGLLHDGMTLMVGGFGLCGVPQNLVGALRDSGVHEPHLCQQQRRAWTGRGWDSCWRHVRLPR